MKKTYRKRYLQNVARALELLTDIEEPQAFVKSYAAAIQQETGLIPCLANNNGYQEAEAQKLSERLTADQIATMIKKDGSWGMHAQNYLLDQVKTAQAYLAKAQQIMDKGGYNKIATK